MRLLSARVRDYRLHRDLAVEFDPRFTVISGPNQSGKSTLAEALHRALFLPVKTGGDLLKGMQSDPYLAEPEVELAFEAVGERWTLRKRFAGSRGSASLQDGRGRSLQGEEAEERLAELIGTSAVARNRGAAEQLKERWGHLWVWQGAASSNPLALSASGYDHDRLVERLQAGADLGVTSALDLAVLDDIQSRWSAVYTAGGANRAPQVKKGSPLQLARAAMAAAQADLAMMEERIDQQAEAEQHYQAAVEQLARITLELPQHQQQRQALGLQLARSRELEAGINQQQPVLEALVKEQTALAQDLQQLQQQQRLVAELEAAQAPGNSRLAALREQLPALESALQQARQQLELLQNASGQAASQAQLIEAKQNRLKLVQERDQLSQQLSGLELLQQRLSQLDRDLESLPAVDGAVVEQLRRLEAAVKAAEVRAESLAAGIEVIRCGQALRLNGELVEAGSTHLLSQAALLQVGDDVELRLLPGGGTTGAEALEAVAKARLALAKALEPYQPFQLVAVEQVATAERRRSDLLAERQNLLAQQRSGGDASKLGLRLQTVLQELEALPLEALPLDPAAGEAPSSTELEGDTLQSRLAQLELELRQARQARDQAMAAEQGQQQQLRQATASLDGHKQAIEQADQELRQCANQLLEAKTRVDALLQRRQSLEALQAAVAELEQQRIAIQMALAALQSELQALDPTKLRSEDQRLEQAIERLQQQEREASEVRIRAESRLHGDGQVDLQAEKEQKDAEVESRQSELRRLEQEAGMLSLLRRLLEEEQNAMGSQYTAPITSRIGRYLAAVFPEAPQPSLEYDARTGFQGLQWRRANEAVFSFAALSTGAREQFAAALRITMAEVLAEAYDGSLPVLFDDAFANSDPERQQGVHRMLQQAADQGLQVILLSCDPERSQGIAGAAQVSLGG